MKDLSSAAIWDKMEEAIHLYKAPRNTSFVAEPKNKESVIAIEEYVYVEMDFLNPISVPLQISELELVVDYTDTHGKVRRGTQQEIGKDIFEVEAYTFQMAPNERKKVIFSLLPKAEGDLRITMLAYSIFGVQVRREIPLTPVRLFQTTSQFQGVFYDDNKKLSLKICGKMPLLDAFFDDDITQIYAGEIKKTVLNLRNVGTLDTFRNLCMKISHPQCFYFGSPEEADLEWPNKSEKMFKSSVTSHTVDNIAKEVSIITLSLNQLAPNDVFRIPVFIRGFQEGLHNLRILLYYEPDTDNSIMKNRTQRVTLSTKITPSIRISTSAHKSETKLDSFLVGLKIENVHDGIFEISQISSISPKWKLLSIGDQQSILLKPLETANLMFHVESNEIQSSSSLNQVELQHTNIPISYMIAFDSSAVPYFPLSTQEKHLRFQAAIQNSIAMTPFQQPVQHHLHKTNDLDLMIFWKSSDCIGMHTSLCVPFLSNESYINYKSPSLAKHDLQSLLLFKLDFPKTISHDFGAEPLCFVPLTVKVKNPRVTTLEFSWQALPPHPIPPHIKSLLVDNQISEVWGSGFVWGGCTETREKLEGEQMHTINFCAGFVKEGVYNLNRFRFLVHLGEAEEHIEIVSTNQILIRLNDTREVATEQTN